MTEEKLIDIETRLAYQDDAIQALSDVIYQQQQQIDKMEKQLQLMVGKLQDLSQNQPNNLDHERPPHY